ncbi:hypothetical protein ACFX11_045293 [Malus domestica]
MRTETVIDLEAPVVVETDIYGEDSIERRRNDSPHGGLKRVAAEALVAGSSCHLIVSNSQYAGQCHWSQNGFSAERLPSLVCKNNFFM